MVNSWTVATSVEKQVSSKDTMVTIIGIAFTKSGAAAATLHIRDADGNTYFDVTIPTGSEGRGFSNIDIRCSKGLKVLTSTAGVECLVITN